MSAMKRSGSKTSFRSGRSSPGNGGGASHLNLDASGLQMLSASQLVQASRAQVLSVIDNDLPILHGLRSVTLSLVYAQQNRIQSIDAESINLPALRKLYLDGNCLHCLSGLASMSSLAELHASSQRIPQPLQLDLDSLISIAGTLQVLSLAGNQLDDVTPLGVLTLLETVDLADNLIDKPVSLVQCVRQWSVLRELKVGGNPLTKRPRHRMHLIAASTTLHILDGRQVLDMERRACKAMLARASSSASAARAAVTTKPSAEQASGSTSKEGTSFGLYFDGG